MARNRIIYVYLLLLSFLFFVLFDLYLFHLLFLFLLILPLVSLLAALPACLTLRYRMDGEDDIMPKGSARVCLTAKNAGGFPCGGVRFRIERRNALGHVGERYAERVEESVSFLLGPGRAHTLRPAVPMDNCGRVDVRVRRVYVSDLLGLFCLPVPKRNGASATGSVYVLPELQSRGIETEDTADLGLDSVTYSTEKPGGDPSEIFQLRDYRPGDSHHSVHWKLSSRMDRLIVREFGLPLNLSLHFLLELREGAGLAAAEQMLGTMLALSEFLMARSAVHSISWLGEEGMLRTVPVGGADALASALHELLALPGQKPWNALGHFAARQLMQPEASLLYLIAGADWDAEEDKGAEKLLASLLERQCCRRITLMPDCCPKEAAQRFRALGCEVQLLDGRVPGMEEEL